MCWTQHQVIEPSKYYDMLMLALLIVSERDPLSILEVERIWFKKDLERKGDDCGVKGELSLCELFRPYFLCFNCVGMLMSYYQRFRDSSAPARL